MVFFLLALQIGILVFVVSTSSKKIDLINRISTITSYFVVLYIISKNDKSLYIPTSKLHLHGHSAPASRRVRSTLTEAEPVVTKC